MNSLELEIKRKIESSEGFNDFIDGKYPQFEVIVCGVPVYIYRKGNCADYHYQQPCNAGYNYNDVSEYMKYAIPIISKMLAERESQRLPRSDF